MTSDPEDTPVLAAEVLRAEDETRAHCDCDGHPHFQRDRDCVCCRGGNRVRALTAAGYSIVPTPAASTTLPGDRLSADERATVKQWDAVYSGLVDKRTTGYRCARDLLAIIDRLAPKEATPDA